MPEKSVCISSSYLYVPLLLLRSISMSCPFYSSALSPSSSSSPAFLGGTLFPSWNPKIELLPPKRSPFSVDFDYYLPLPEKRLGLLKSITGETADLAPKVGALLLLKIPALLNSPTPLLLLNKFANNKGFSGFFSTSLCYSFCYFA